MKTNDNIILYYNSLSVIDYNNIISNYYKDLPECEKKSHSFTVRSREGKKNYLGEIRKQLVDTLVSASGYGVIGNGTVNKVPTPYLLKSILDYTEKLYIQIKNNEENIKIISSFTVVNESFQDLDRNPNQDYLDIVINGLHF